MTHTAVYLGRFDENFDRLKLHQGFHLPFQRKHDGKLASIGEPSTKADGIVFGYMEKSRRALDPQDIFVAVTVGPVILDNPVPIAPSIHTEGKQFGPEPSQFGDPAAKSLLLDIIQRNPGQQILWTIHDHFLRR